MQTMKSTRRVSVLAVLTLLATALSVAVAPAASAAGPTVFINELHYDNAGTDVGEFIEIAGPAGTDLGGWLLVLYNGSTGAVYDTDALSGTIDDEGAGFGALSFSYPANGIQNGPPDGIALVNGTTVVEFLSYEGSFTAVGGAANGMTSTDIGVAEGSGTPIGDSLQKVGTGTMGGDFSWATPAPESPGTINSGQTFSGGPVAPDLVINEIDYDQVGTDGAEFVEIRNNGAGDADLTDVQLRLVNGTGGGAAIYTQIDLAGTVAAGDYYVVCGDAATVANCDLDVSPDTNLVQNGDPDAVALVFGESETIIDTVSYEGDTGAPYTEGTGTTAADSNTVADVGISRCADGEDTDDNDTDFSQELITPGAANDCTIEVGLNPGDLVINEIMQNPSAVSDSNGEWFEVYNDTADPIDLQGLTIKDDGSNIHVIGSSVIVAAGDYAVLGINDDSLTNGGLTVDYEYSDFFLGNSDDEVVILDDGVEIDRVDYDNGATFPDPNGAAMALDETTSDNNDGANWCTATTPYGEGDSGTPGAPNDCPLPPDFGECGDGFATFIHTIQGADAATSPLAGQFVVLEGVVVGDFQGGSGLDGFFVQEEDLDIDGDPTSSEGVFVDDGAFGVDVANGDVVRVRGLVVESFSQTEVTDVLDVVVCAAGETVTAATVTFPVSAVDDLEDTEGMLVSIPQTLHVSGNFSHARFGEVDLSVGGPLDNPTNIAAPGAPALAQADLNNRSRIQLDDGSSVSNPLPLPPYLGTDGTLRTGDTIPGITAVLGYSFGSYELHPQDPSSIKFTRTNDRPSAPPDVGGSLTIAAYNVLNYFTTLDDAGPICGPSGTLGCRGADNAFELARQKSKLVDALSDLDADVVGLIEIENPAGDGPLDDLVSGVNSVAGAGTYDYVATGAVGSDAIRVAIMYKPASVTPVGPFAILDSSVDPNFIDTKNRPVLIQTFEENATSERFTVAVNHLKSKGSPCDDVGDPDAGDGQGNCSGTRTKAAQALVDYLATDPTGGGTPNYLIIGDLNAYAQEDPITTIEGAGYTDLVEEYLGAGYAAGAYSFNFNSESGYLDHALASPSMTSLVTGAGLWHVNADEPRGLDYNDFNQPSLFNPDQFRSSDHDPIVIGLQLADPRGDKDATIDALETLLPTGSRLTDRRIGKAIDEIEASRNPAWWDGPTAINNKKVFDRERQAVVQLELVVASGVAEAAAAQAAIDVLVNADRQLAQVAINAAIAGGGNAGRIADAQAEMAEAAADVVAGLFNEAVNHYKTAWDQATKAL